MIKQLENGNETCENKEKSYFHPIIFRAVERVVGGHLEGFDHKTVRNWRSEFVSRINLSKVNNIFESSGEQH